MHRSEFLKELKKAFPHLREGINKEFGLLHLEVNVFTLFTQQCINKQDSEKLMKCYKLAEKAYRIGDARLKNAIDVSFVEPLEFKNNKWAWDMMPDILQKLFTSFHGKPPC